VGTADLFWTQPRIAGAVITGGTVLLLAISVPFYLRGDIRAVEAQFRPIEVAVGNIPVLRVASAGIGPWVTILLAGFVVLCIDLIRRGNVVLPVLAIVGLTVFTVVWILESAFHAGVTVWAVGQLEAGEAVPELFHQMKTWLNVYVQWMVNPLAFLSFIAIAIASLRTGVLPGWAAWGTIVWSAVWFFIPFPLALFPVPVFIGTVLLVNG
jgi:hypothetical protein